jgi:hypothetical protein
MTTGWSLISKIVRKMGAATDSSSSLVLTKAVGIAALLKLGT